MRRYLYLVITVGIIFIQCQRQGAGDTEVVAVPVKVMQAGLDDVKQSLTFQGDIRAEVEVKVFAKIPDRIISFAVDEGDYVKKGDLIAEILATTIEQAARQAEAHKNNMETEFTRAQRLVQQDAMSQQQFDIIQTQVTQARAAFESAQSQLDDAKIIAPISGIIGKRYVEAGDMATPAVPLVSIVKMDQVKIVFEATEEDLGKLKVGQETEIEVRSYPDRIFLGTLQKISPILDPVTRMALIEVLIPNSDHLLKPGMYAEADVTVGILKDVLVIPRYAVLENTSLIQVEGKDRVVKNYFLYVVNDSSYAEQRKLDVDYVNHVQITVKNGVDLGERFVVSGMNNLRDGVPVLITDGEEAK